MEDGPQGKGREAQRISSCTFPYGHCPSFDSITGRGLGSTNGPYSFMNFA